MKLIGLLVLLALVSLVEGEVVDSFADSCSEFFVKDQNNKPVTPTVLVSHKRFPNGTLIPRYKQICQKLGNKYRYATHYDTETRIPVYSAYQYTGYKNIDRPSNWMIEPQLDDSSTGPEMAPPSAVDQQVRGNNQALPENYQGSGYEKGHLYPHCHNCNQGQAESTFTLTNAAPQKAEDNTDWYGQVEKVSANLIYNWCQPGTARVVTGVVPGATGIGEGSKVKVPDFFWSAFCCQKRGSTRYGYSQAFLAATKTGMKEKYGRHPQGAWKMVAETKSVTDLNRDLKNLYKLNEFKVFGDVCL